MTLCFSQQAGVEFKYVQEALTAKLMAEADDVYVCGNPEMISSIKNKFYEFDPNLVISTDAFLEKHHESCAFGGWAWHKACGGNNSLPKPMVEIGGWPILWHIMKIYSHYGVKDFVIALGYKGYVIKEYFANYLCNSDITIDLAGNTLSYSNARSEDWTITLIDTGENTMTGGRLKRLESILCDEEEFFLTYGDGVADINIKDLHNFHKDKNRLVTMSCVTPPARFGSVVADENNIVTKFVEKPKDEQGQINGGFFVMKPRIFDFISGDDSILEKDPLEEICGEGRLQRFLTMVSGKQWTH